MQCLLAKWRLNWAILPFKGGAGNPGRQESMGGYEAMSGDEIRKRVGFGGEENP